MLSAIEVQAVANVGDSDRPVHDVTGFAILSTLAKEGTDPKQDGYAAGKVVRYVLHADAFTAHEELWDQRIAAIKQSARFKQKTRAKALEEMGIVEEVVDVDAAGAVGDLADVEEPGAAIREMVEEQEEQEEPLLRDPSGYDEAQSHDFR